MYGKLPTTSQQGIRRFASIAHRVDRTTGRRSLRLRHGKHGSSKRRYAGRSKGRLSVGTGPYFRAVWSLGRSFHVFGSAALALVVVVVTEPRGRPEPTPFPKVTMEEHRFEIGIVGSLGLFPLAFAAFGRADFHRVTVFTGDAKYVSGQFIEGSDQGWVFVLQLMADATATIVKFLRGSRRRRADLLRAVWLPLP